MGGTISPSLPPAQLSGQPPTGIASWNGVSLIQANEHAVPTRDSAAWSRARPISDPPAATISSRRDGERGSNPRLDPTHLLSSSKFCKSNARRRWCPTLGVAQWLHPILWQAAAPDTWIFSNSPDWQRTRMQSRRYGTRLRLKCGEPCRIFGARELAGSQAVAGRIGGVVSRQFQDPRNHWMLAPLGVPKLLQRLRIEDLGPGTRAKSGAGPAGCLAAEKRLNKQLRNTGDVLVF